MQQKINSRIIGTLDQDAQFPDWWNSSKIPVPLFDSKPIQFIYMDFDPELEPEFLIEADNAVENFLKLNNEYRYEISPLVVIAV